MNFNFTNAGWQTGAVGAVAAVCEAEGIVAAGAADSVPSEGWDD